MIDYLALFPIVLLFLTSAILVILRLIRPGFAFSWLVAAFGALLAWILVLFSRANLPQTISIFTWEPDWFFTQSPYLLIDQFSWAYAFCISTLILSAILTDIARPGETNWFVWVGNLLLGALGLIAVQSGNLLTLLMLWTAIDLVEVIILLYRVTKNTQGARVIIAFSARIAGILLLIWAILSTTHAGVSLEYYQFPFQTSLLLLAAAVLRLGVVPLRQTYFDESLLRRNLGSISRLITAATSLVLITRVADVGYQGLWSPYLIAFSGLIAIYAALMWATSKDELEGQLYWILGIASLAITSAIRKQPDASLAWGVSAILTGGLLFLVSTRFRYLFIILIIGFLGLSALPFTPAWNGVLLYTPDFTLLLIFFLIAQSIFMVGYLRFTLRPAFPQSGLERWVWVIYPWGLAIMPVSQYIIAWLGWRVELSLSTLLPGMLVLLSTGIWFALNDRLKRQPARLQEVKRILNGINKLFAMDWVFRLIGRLYFTIGRSISFIVAVLDGDGGVLWALLFVVLFIAILTQIRIGM